jgi:hypothetical protein
MTGGAEATSTRKSACWVMTVSSCMARASYR